MINRVAIIKKAPESLAFQRLAEIIWRYEDQRTSKIITEVPARFQYPHTKKAASSNQTAAFCVFITRKAQNTGSVCAHSQPGPDNGKTGGIEYRGKPLVNSYWLRSGEKGQVMGYGLTIEEKKKDE